MVWKADVRPLSVSSPHGDAAGLGVTPGAWGHSPRLETSSTGMSSRTGRMFFKMSINCPGKIVVYKMRESLFLT